jgi:formate hydrogenlyase regulatory protein HycA
MFNFFRKSKFPKLIPIKRMQDYHTHYLGKIDDGRLFFGSETFAYTETNFKTRNLEDRIDFAVLYLFDKKGDFQEAIYFMATSQTEKNLLSIKLDELVNSLGKIKFCDIKVKPFETIIEGIKFGLIIDGETESIDLEPSSTISFSEPWDGEYYT